MNRRINQVILGIIIYYQIVLNSAWGYLEDISFWKYVGYTMYICLLVKFIYDIWTKRLTQKQIISLTIYGAVMILFLAFGNLSVASVFLIGMFSLLISVDELLDVFLHATIGGVLTTFVLSLFGVLPLYNTTIDYWVFGFKNPNNVGYYLVLIFGLLLIKQWNSPRFNLFIYFVVMSVINKYVVFDMTALLVSIVMAISWLTVKYLPRLFELPIIARIVYLSPFLLTALTVLIGKLYGRLNILYKLDNVFTSRPAIWHYYLNHFPLKLIGSNIVGEVTVYRGAFDGVFIYYPLTNGAFVSVIFLILLSITLYNAIKHKRPDIISFILAMLLIAFSENAPYFVYSSPLLLIAIMMGTPGMQHNPSMVPLDFVQGGS